MVSIDEIRGEMKERLEVDNQLNQVEVNASTIDEALADASVQLDLTAGELEYEVVEKGSSGFLGIGKKTWKLKIYQNQDIVIKKKKASRNEDSSVGNQVVQIESRDGLFYVHRFSDSIKLKVLVPIGDGRDVDVQDVLEKVQRQDTKSFDKKLIEKYVKEGTDGKYETIGSYAHVSAADASIAVDVSKDEMHGTITVDEPKMSGAELSAEQIETALKNQGVIAGINLDKINEFVDNPIYGSPVEVASAILPEDGKNAYLDYKFETDPTKLKASESNTGNIDFKELNQIQNVVKGQVLAVKVLASRGKGGKTLYGRYLEARNGVDVTIKLGSNVEFESDGVTIVASENGQVILENGLITVQPILTLPAVNIKSGNINFLGTVIIKGNVEDGFSVKASGDIDIGGIVGKSQIEADGNIIIHQGVFGKNEGYIKCKKSLWLKFAQEMKIEVEENVIATDSLLNCDVVAMKNIVVYGKKAKINGGNLFATEEICAREVGSPGGSATKLSVGVDPRAKMRQEELMERQSSLTKELATLELDIGTLENLKKVRRALPKDKEENLKKFIERKKELTNENEELTNEINSLQEYLHELKAVGKVKVEGVTYPGTKIYVRDIVDEVRTEVSNCTFYYDAALSKRGKYEPPSLDVTRGPEGYN